MGDHLRCITGGALGQRAATATRFLQGDWRPTAERFLVGLGVRAGVSGVRAVSVTVTVTDRESNVLA